MRPRRSLFPPVVILAWLIFAAIVVVIYRTHPDGGRDFHAYVLGAERLIDGSPLYPDSDTYIYPPLLAILLVPLVRAIGDGATVALVWLWLNLGALLATVALLARRSPPANRAFLWLAPLVFAPAIHSLWVGQVTVLLLALTAAAWAAHHDERRGLAGALLALAVWTKFYPALLLLYFVWKRDWRVVRGAALATAVVIAVQIAAVGWPTFAGYFTDVLPGLAAEGQSFLNHSNNSILGLSQRLFAASPQVIPLVESRVLLNLTRLGLSAGLLALVLMSISRPAAMAATPRERFDLEYALVTLAALLLGSTLFLTGQLSLLLVYMLLARAAQPRPVDGWRTRAALLVSHLLLLAHLFIILGYLKPPSAVTLPALALSLPFAALLIPVMLLAGRLLPRRGLRVAGLRPRLTG